MSLQTPYFLGAIAGDSAIQYTAREMRLPADAFAYTEGVCGIGHFAVTQRGAGANVSVDIGPGVAIVTGDVGSNQGKYLQRNDGIVNFTGIPALPTSGTRRHLLCLEVNDRQAGAATYLPDFRLVQDTVGAGALPDLPANCLPLAEIRRTFGQAEGTSVINSKIFSQRLLAGAIPATVGSFEFYGGNGQRIDRAASAVYGPFGLRRAPLGCTVASPTAALVANLLPGSWDLEAETKVNGITAGFRQILIEVALPDGSFQRTEGTGPLGASASGATSMSCRRRFIIPSGCTATVKLYQDVQAFTNVNDSDGVCHFTGHYNGPVPGVF